MDRTTKMAILLIITKTFNNFISEWCDIVFEFICFPLLRGLVKMVSPFAILRFLFSLAFRYFEINLENRMRLGMKIKLA